MAGVLANGHADASANAQIDGKADGFNCEIGDGQLVQALTQFTPLPDAKCIMVTGGAGFVGSWVVRSFCNSYNSAYKIISFDKLDYAATLDNTRALEGNENFCFVRGDITSEEDVTSCITYHNVDTIIHFAAHTHVDSSFSDPYGFANANIHGVHVMLECAKTCGVKRFLHMSSYEVYGAVTPGAKGHVEDSRLAPVNPYAASKAAGETLVAAYGRSSNLQTFIIRSQNVYGPNQYPEKIIPKFALLINRGMNLPLYGAGNNTRRYVYAGDVADAFNTIMHRGTPGEVYNIGSAHEISNRELCGRLIKAISPPGCDTSDVSAWLDPTPDRPFHDHGSGLDCSKLQALGWKQTVDFNQGLQSTVDWYVKHGERWWGHVMKHVATK